MKRSMIKILVLSILMVLCVTACGLVGIPHTINQTPMATVTPNPALMHEPNYEVQIVSATFLPANLTQLTVFQGWKPVAGKHLLYGHYDKNYNNEVCFREDIHTEICDKKLNPDDVGIVWSP